MDDTTRKRLIRTWRVTAAGANVGPWHTLDAEPARVGVYRALCPVEPPSNRREIVSADEAPVGRFCPACRKIEREREESGR